MARNRTTNHVPTAHASITATFLYETLVYVIRELGKNAPGTDWHQNLYEEVQDLFSKSQELIAIMDADKASNVDALAEAFRTALRTIDSAFDHTAPKQSDLA